MGRAIDAVLDGRTRSEDLVQVALGHQHADLVIRGGQLIDVFGGEIRPADIAIKGERIAFVGDVAHTVGGSTRVVDATGMYLSPGLIDAHVHIEASMLSPTQFARAVLPTGNTTVLWETLWTGNVLGAEGIKFFLEEAKRTPLKVFATATSGVPPTNPELATAAHQFTYEDLNQLLDMDQILSLGEVGYINEVLSCDPAIHQLIRLALDKGKQVDASAAGLTEKQLYAFRSAGLVTDHEAVTTEEALHRVRCGMWLIIREAPGMANLAESIKAITVHNLNAHRVCFCVDDKAIGDVAETGAIDDLVRKSIDAGLDPVTAVQIGSLNAATYMRLDNDLGGIAPGMVADILLVKDLADFRAHRVIANGEIIALDGRLTVDIRSPAYPDFVSRTMRVGRALVDGDFVYPSDREGSTQVRVIRIDPHRITSYQEIETLPVRHGAICLPDDPARDILKVIMVERHGKTPGPNIARGFAKGFGLRDGAVAVSIAPDINQMILLGAANRDMVKAANRLIELQGGIVICRRGEILAELALPVGGVMSSQPSEEMLPLLDGVLGATRELGCTLPAPIMTLAFVGGVGALPYLRISDKGLIDIMRGEIVPLEVD